MVYKEGRLLYTALINPLHVYIGETEGDYNLHS